MITNLIMAILISAAGVSTNLVYNVKMENNRLANKEVFSVENGKYLKRLFKMDFTYNAQGQVTDKKTYVWSDARQNYVLQQTETFNPTDDKQAEYPRLKFDFTYTCPPKRIICRQPFRGTSVCKQKTIYPTTVTITRQ